MKKTIHALIILFTFLIFSISFSEELTIIHTNDMHSQLLGLAPNSDYSPMTINDDSTFGGWARIATIIKNIKKNAASPVLVLDAGDFMMGSLYHVIAREYAVELQLMKKMGYDCITLGNHEFDLMPKGLARIIRSAYKNNGLPNIVASNVIFSKKSSEDDSLEKIFNEKLVKPYIVIKKGKLKIGLFGLMGKAAWDVSPFAKPVTFGDPIASAQNMVSLLRNKEKVDIVICLSHGGLDVDPSKSEDEILAKEVSGIDVIISGHSHSRMNKPVTINNTIIVQSWEYGKEVGILTLNIKNKKLSIKKYQPLLIDDKIKGDETIHKIINHYQGAISMNVLKFHGVGFRSPVAQTSFNLQWQKEESTIGNLVTDAILWYANKNKGKDKTPFTGAFESNGIIRDSLLKGKTGIVSMADLYRVFPMGIGMDDTMGYPLVSFYINAKEIKNGSEILTTIAPMKGADYFIQVAGFKIKYNPKRMLFDRVTDIWIKENNKYIKLDISQKNKKLYRFTANMYNAAFFSLVGDYTANILKITPKDKDGKPYKGIKEMLLDGNTIKPGTQEIKEWVAILKFIKNFKDKDGNGIADIPDRYKKPQGRIIKAASLNPYHLLRGGSWLTWSVFGGIILVLGLISFIAVRFFRKIKK